jgi:hypothetical protein
MVKFAAVVSFWLVVAFYGGFVFRRIVRRSATGSAFPEYWPRGRRLALLVSAVVLTAVVIIPATIVAVGYVFGMTDCPADFSSDQPWRCSRAGRFLFMSAGIVLGLPLVALWLRWVLNLSYKNAGP